MVAEKLVSSATWNSVDGDFVGKSQKAQRNHHEEKIMRHSLVPLKIK
jgi:hypothetical protein